MRTKDKTFSVDEVTARLDLPSVPGLVKVRSGAPPKSPVPSLTDNWPPEGEKSAANLTTAASIANSAGA